MADDFKWFTMTLHADGRHMASWVNGYQVCDWTDARAVDENPRRGLRLKPGTIQIQGHVPDKEEAGTSLEQGGYAAGDWPIAVATMRRQWRG